MRAYLACGIPANGFLRVRCEDQPCRRLLVPWSDGTTSLVLSPTELIEELAALVPPPRTDRIRARICNELGEWLYWLPPGNQADAGNASPTPKDNSTAGGAV